MISPTIDEKISDEDHGLDRLDGSLIQIGRHSETLVRSRNIKLSSLLRCA